MRTIHKHNVPIDGEWYEIEMFSLAKVILVGTQDPRSVTFWVETITDAPLDRTKGRKFRVFGTGEELPRDMAGYASVHVGSVNAGQFVWHLYELKE